MWTESGKREGLPLSAVDEFKWGRGWDKGGTKEDDSG